MLNSQENVCLSPRVSVKVQSKPKADSPAHPLMQVVSWWLVKWVIMVIGWSVSLKVEDGGKQDLLQGRLKCKRKSRSSEVTQFTQAQFTENLGRNSFRMAIPTLSHFLQNQACMRVLSFPRMAAWKNQVKMSTGFRSGPLAGWEERLNSRLQ